MRIGIDATPAIKQLGGVSEYTRQLISHLASMDHENVYRLVTFSLFRSRTNPLPLLAPNFQERPIFLPASMIEQLWLRGGFPPFSLFAGGLDLAFFPQPLPARTAAPSIMTVHDLASLVLPGMAPERDVERYRQRLPRVARQITHMIAVSEATKRDLLTVVGVSADKVTVIYEGFDDSLSIDPGERAVRRFREQFGVGEVPYLLHVGTIEPRKNLARLVRAFGSVKKKAHLPHKLVLVGRLGWMYDDVLRAVRESRLMDDLVLTGSLPNEQRAAAYWGAEAFLFPSLYEGFGIPVLEAQAAQRPVLTGTGGSLAEVGRDSVLAVDVTDEDTLAEGIARIIGDPKLRSRLIQAGLTNIRRFSWKTMARETLNVFQEVGSR